MSKVKNPLADWTKAKVEEIQTAGQKMSERYWANINNQYMIKPIRGGDGRVLIREDEFTSKRDCATCKGLGHCNQPCQECKGNGRFRGKKDSEDNCTTCYILRDKSQASNSGAWINLNGKQPCGVCGGLGTSSIVIPDDSKKRTTTGDVIAISPQGIIEVSVGCKVIYTNYTGSPFDFADAKLLIVVEKDLLAIIKKLKTNVDSIAEDTFADLDNTGVAHVK